MKVRGKSLLYIGIDKYKYIYNNYKNKKYKCQTFISFLV